MKSNTKHCQKCGAEITDEKAQKCTECGAKISTPIFKKWWFWVIIVLGLIIIGSATSSDSEGEGSLIKNETKNETKYETVEIQQMMDDLDQNALKAESTYKNKYVQITGKIANFDSSGSYITIESVNAGEWNFDTIMCYIKNDSQRDLLMEKSVGDVVTIKGKIIRVGEVLGYSLNIDEIK